jgi:EVE domain
MTKYWLGVVHRSHALRGVDAGIARTNHGARFGMARMSRGDGFVFYSPKTTYPDGPALKAFTAIGRVVDDEEWQGVEAEGQENEFHPWQRRIDYDLSAHEAPIAPLVETLELTRGHKNWGFQLLRGHLEISKNDFLVIAAEMGSATVAG